MKFESLSRAKKILIYGMGREGQSALRFLEQKFPGAKMATYEDGATPSKPFDFEKYDLVVVSPGIAREKLEGVRRPIITSGTELFFENLPDEFRRRVIGITGTKGKSTTAKFIHEMLANAGLRSAIGGNFGVPLLDLYEDFLAGKYDWLVVEFSSYQLENLRTSPGIAVYLNLYPDHLDRHHTLTRYRRAKENIFKFQEKGDSLVVPKKWAKLAGRRMAMLTSPAPANLFPIGSPFRAKHLLENFGAAIAVAKILKIPQNAIRKTAAKFVGLPHRMELFAVRDGITFCDDAISTNPDSTMAAVRFFGKRLGSVILGGQDRGQNFESLITELKKRGSHIIVFPSAVSERIMKSGKKLGYEKRLWLARNFKDAVRVSFEQTPQGKIALLSTAAPSYGTFKNFEEKGDLFKKYVNEF